MTKENPSKKGDPITEFPHFPGYNQKKDSKNLLPWSWAENNIEKSVNYWISTMSKSKPYLTPIWGVWLNNRFYFSTGRLSKKARNLMINKWCTVSTEQSNNPVIIEGEGNHSQEKELLKIIAVIYNKKYNWTFKYKNNELIDELGNSGPIFEVKPKKVIGWEQFPTSVTKWVFN